MKNIFLKAVLLSLFAFLFCANSFACDWEIKIKETIKHDFRFPLDGHRYDYASIVDFYYWRWPDSFLWGVWIGTHRDYPCTLSWTHTLPENLLVPPYSIDRAKLWIDGGFIETKENIAEIEGVSLPETLDHHCFDNTTIDLKEKLSLEFWNNDSLRITVIAGECLLKLDEAKILLDFHQECSSADEDQENLKLDGFTLLSNYPNPFNPKTIIEYNLPEDCWVRLSVYNLRGQKVKTLVNEYQSKGKKSIIWDGKDQKGERTSSGVYFYSIKAKDFEETKKMVLTK